MPALFVALGIAVLALLALLLWFVPHLLQQQAVRSANESAQLREMLLDMLSEQEAVTMRQAQLGTSISYLQDQLEQAVTAAPRAIAPAADSTELRRLEERMSVVQTQIQSWLEGRVGAARKRDEQDNEAWARLMGLLATIQERVGQLSQERAAQATGAHAQALLEDLEQEMSNLRSISEDIARLQWRLRRSLNEREVHTGVLGQPGGSRVHQRA
jgi:Na+/phosphate symporter